jgi:hypothetical protein
MVAATRVDWKKCMVEERKSSGWTVFKKIGQGSGQQIP